MTFTLVLYVAAPFMYVHSLSGLETILFTCALLACMWATVNAFEASRYQLIIDIFLVASLLILSLTRPEGVILAFVLVPMVLYGKLRYGQGSVKRFILLFIVLYGIPALAYIVFKLSYYGELLPNS